MLNCTIIIKKVIIGVRLLLFASQTHCSHSVCFVNRTAAHTTCLGCSSHWIMISPCNCVNSAFPLETTYILAVPEWGHCRCNTGLQIWIYVSLLFLPRSGAVLNGFVLPSFDPFECSRLRVVHGVLHLLFWPPNRTFGQALRPFTDNANKVT